MNLRTTKVQLFLITATAMASRASAFVLPSSYFTKCGSVLSTGVAIPAPAASTLAIAPRRGANLPCVSLGLSTTTASSSSVKSDELFKDLDDLSADLKEGGKGVNDTEKGLKLLETFAEILEHLGSPGSAYLKHEPLAEPPVSRKSVLVETPHHHEVSELMSKTYAAELEKAEPEQETSSTLAMGAGIIRELVKAYASEALTGEMKYSSYSRHPEFPDVDLSWMMKKMDGAPPPEYFFDATKIKRLIKRVAKLTVGLKLTQNRVNRASAERVFEEFFTDITPLVPKPKRLIKHWDNDKELARQMLCGVNPVMIMVTKDLSQLSDNIATHFGERKLQGLIDEKRLFFVSYDDIAELEVNPHQGKPAPMNPTPQDDPRPFYAPIAIFALDETRKELDIMGIQLERTDDAKVYTKADGNEWLFAKIHLSSTDSNIHEWVSHLGKTHLTMEPHILAIHNTLKMKDHKVYTFLAPLCKDTLFLNWAARKTLAGFSAGAFGDEQSSIGVGQFMQINRNWWSTYNFFESSGLPSELASRGFDKDFDMPPYLFREDGMQLWDAYGEFAADFVNEIYKSDAEVNEDDDIQAWAKETSAFDKAAVPGFPATIKDKVTLVNILQTLMWIPSGLHAAVNFPQYDFYAYAPNKPLAMRALLPASNCEDIFKNALPTVANAQQIITTTTILTLPSQDCIDNLQNNFSTIGNKSYTKFQSKLDEIGDGIERRNKESKKAGNAVYSYLNPSVVPASIDI